MILSAEAAADLHGDDSDLGDGHVQHLGNRVPGCEGALRAAPDVHPVVLVPQRGRVVRLDVPLMDRLGIVLPLYDYVGLGEPLRNVSLGVLEVLGEVARLVGLFPELRCFQVVVKEGSALFHPVGGGQHRWQDIVLDVDKHQRFLGYVRTGGRDTGHRMASVKHLVAGKDVVAKVLQAPRALSDVHRLVRDAGKVPGCDHAPDSLQGLGLAGVDGPDPGVGVGTAQDLAVQQAGGIEVGPVKGASGHPCLRRRGERAAFR